MPIAAFTPTRGASSVCRQRTLRAGQFIFERTKTVRHKGHLINPHNSHEFSKKHMHLPGKPEGDPCLSLYKPTVSERRLVQRLWCLIIMLIEASVFTRGETESFFEGPVEVGEVIEA